MVMSYFCGIIRFGSCLYCCRSTQCDLDAVRFYYVMAASAILGLNAYDIVGASCCNNMSVKDQNSEYKHLLEVVGLPSLERMAQKDSVATVKQVADIYPDFLE